MSKHTKKMGQSCIAITKPYRLLFDIISHKLIEVTKKNHKNE